jgi:Skp family chaperone for outer membrane proteins
MLKIFPITFLFLIFFNTIAISQEKIVFFDIDNILNNSIAGKKILLYLDEINKDNISNLKKNELEIKNSEKKLLSKKNLINEEEFNNEIKLIETKIREFRLLKQNLTSEFIKKKENEILKFINLVNPIIEKYMKENNIGLVLDKKNVFIAKSNYDITSILLSIINKEIKDYSIK